MKTIKFLVTTIFLALMFSPIITQASWFGIGEAVSGVADATARTAEAGFDMKWKLALIQAIERAFPSIILLTTILSTVTSALTAGWLVMKLHETAQATLRDGKISKSDWVILSTLASITLPVALGLAYFAFFLMSASRSGLMELMQ